MKRPIKQKPSPKLQKIGLQILNVQINNTTSSADTGRIVFNDYIEIHAFQVHNTCYINFPDIQKATYKLGVFNSIFYDVIQTGTAIVTINTSVSSPYFQGQFVMLPEPIIVKTIFFSRVTANMQASFYYKNYKP